MKKLMLILTLLLGSQAFSQDYGFRWNWSKSACYSDYGTGDIKGFNNGWVSRSNGYAECSDLTRDSQPLDRVVMTNANFLGARVIRRNFVLSDMRGSNLDHANFTGSIFSEMVDGQLLTVRFRDECEVNSAHGINFIGSNLATTKMFGVNFCDARFDRAIMMAGDFHLSDFHRANLRGADLSYANLEDADFSYARAENAIFMQAKMDRVTFFYTKAEGANFKKIEGKGHQFTYCGLQNTIFSFSDLENANFEKTSMSGTNFFKARCYKCRFKDSYLNNANFQQGNFSRSSFESAQLYGVNFRFSQLQRANFKDAWLANADLRNADLRNTNLKDADILRTAIFNDQTKLPFSKEYALSRNMIFME